MEALAGEYIRNFLQVKRFPCISLVCKLVPVQYREYEYSLFQERFPVRRVRTSSGDPFVIYLIPVYATLHILYDSTGYSSIYQVLSQIERSVKSTQIWTSFNILH